MPTIPLYSPPMHPDGGHRVTAPGGGEWWHFEARSSSDDLRLVATFGYGLPFDREYVRRYERYIRRPTRIAPPLPADFALARVELFRGARLESSTITRYAADEFVAASDRADVRVGPFAWRDSVLTLSGGIELSFRPRAAGSSSAATSAVGGAIDAPGAASSGVLCDVEGLIHSRAFAGVGSFEHRFSTAMPAPK